MKRVTTLFAFLIISFSSFSQTWTKLALPETGKSMVDIVVGADDNLYVLTKQGLYKSTDDGVSWTLYSLEAYGSELMGVTTKGRAYMDHGYIMSYTDGGEAKHSTRVFDSKNVLSASMVSLSDGKIIILDGPLVTGKRNYTVSTDDGATFQTKNITAFKASQGNHRTLFSMENDDVYFYGTDKAIHRSTDKGESFTSAGTAINVNGTGFPLAFDAKNGNIYLWTKVGLNAMINKSTDHGVTWTTVRDHPTFVHSIAAYDDQVVAYSNSLMYYSTDGGNTWSEKTALFDAGSFPSQIIISKTGKVLGINAGINGVVEIDFTNDKVVRRTKGIDYTWATGLSYNGTRLAANLSEYAHYTDDNGSTWTALKGEGAISNEVFVTKKGVVYTAQTKTGTWAGVYKQDANDSMIKVMADKDEVWNLNSMFEDDKGGLYCMSNLHGLYKSTDGLNFIKLENAPFDNLYEQVVWFSEANSRMYSIQTKQEIIHYSDDYGVTWTEGEKVPDLSFGNYIHFKGKDRMWVRAWSTKPEQVGFYYSYDLKNWTGPFKSAQNFDDRWSQFVKGDKEQNLFVANDENIILHSTDTGKTWNPFIEGLDSVKVFDVFGSYKSQIPYINFIGEGDKLVLSTKGSIYMASQETGPSTVKNLNSTPRIILYPNPVNNLLKFKGTSGVDEIVVYALDGRELLRNSNPSDSINVTSLVDGTYFVMIKSGEVRTTQKVVVRH